MSRHILAIDPGASGGLVKITPGGLVTAVAMPDDAALCDFFATFDPVGDAGEPIPAVCYMEIVGGFIAGNPLPGSRMFNFGNGYGYIRGLLAANRIELRLIRPQQWQAGIPGLFGQKSKPIRKRKLKEHAARLFPQLKVTLKTSDALCIADYGRRQERGAA